MSIFSFFHNLTASNNVIIKYSLQNFTRITFKSLGTHIQCLDNKDEHVLLNKSASRRRHQCKAKQRLLQRKKKKMCRIYVCRWMCFINAIFDVDGCRFFRRFIFSVDSYAFEIRFSFLRQIVDSAHIFHFICLIRPTSKWDTFISHFQFYFPWCDCFSLVSFTRPRETNAQSKSNKHKTDEKNEKNENDNNLQE